MEREAYPYDGIWPQDTSWRVLLFLSWFIVTPFIGIGVGLWRLIVGARTSPGGRALFLSATLLVVAATAGIAGAIGGYYGADSGASEKDLEERYLQGTGDGYDRGRADGQTAGYAEGVNAGKKELCWQLADGLVRAGNAAGPNVAKVCQDTYGGR